MSDIITDKLNVKPDTKPASDAEFIDASQEFNMEFTWGKLGKKK